MEFNLKEFRDEIELTGYKINKYCDLLLLGNDARADRFVLVLSEAFSSLIPKIIQAYDHLDCLRGEDSSIWLFQLKRILEALDSNDDMKRVDILKLETVENLKILLEALDQQDE